MRNRLILAAAGLAASLAIAAPASADQQYRYGYSQPVYNYGYNQGYRGDVRQMHAQVIEIRRDLNQFERRRMLSRKEARKLDKRAVKLERRIYRSGRYGINRGEYVSIQRGIQNLRMQVRRELRDGRRYDRRYDRRHDRRGHDRDWDDRDDRWDD